MERENEDRQKKPLKPRSVNTGQSTATELPTPKTGVQWDEVQCHQKAKERGDMTFTLVGQDMTSPSTICWWILCNIETCTADKLRNALERAIQMRALPNRKSAD